MSTGADGTFQNPPSGWTGLRSYRSWNGADGRYEVYNGSIRDKWNSYSATKLRLQAFTGTVGYRCPLGDVTQYGVGFNWYNNFVSGSNLPAFSSADKNAALAKMLAKVKDHSFNAAVFSSQLHLSVRMTVDVLGALGRSIMALKHGDFATAARNLGVDRPTLYRGGRVVQGEKAYSRLSPKDVAGRWLELQYGWKPLLSDVYDSWSAYSALRNGPIKSVFRTGRRYTGTQVMDSQATGNDRVTLRQERYLSYTFELAEELAFSRQLGLLDPLSVLWEVTPYSFVVDWFVPIGTYLSNLNQIPYLKGRWLVSECTMSRDPVWSSKNPQSLWGYCPNHLRQFTSIVNRPSVSYSGYSVNRDALSSPPKVSFPTARLNGAVHGTRIANAISLAYQRFLR